MPELPEVETIRAGLEPVLVGQTVTEVHIRQAQLRYLIPGDLPPILRGQKIMALQRRAKYLLLQMEQGIVLIHLGMSGSLRFVSTDQPPERHDHVDFVLDHGILRYRDPRRFGLVLWHPACADPHRLLQHLGPEPLGDEFTSAYLCNKAQGSKRAIKNFIMDSQVVVGVGNIYANEALFLARIHPLRLAGTLSMHEWKELQRNIVAVLHAGIKAGGTTLQDFVNGSGKPGYFQQQLLVYGRDKAPCPVCGEELHKEVIGQRSSWFCPVCQR
ncbi:MAG: bifunctional DNA-formamidopyrimidine glycosylase/DNA-(apurinic or apyrimidinic site) lyase [Geobacteraceae bacterium]|nr:bifunctional DNA-formamidopyrimidine glycosylase/DNA-(apurinic or apyrimidinic site) lyase [Geobacteraceae bacterium]